MGEKHGLTDLRESHRRAKYRVHRRFPHVHHGIVAVGKWSMRDCINYACYRLRVLPSIITIIFMRSINLAQY